ncbi:MAG: excinuclease ABC subunit UvrA [Sphaerochaetaceae bacterium]|nr:excinuclease ABC subunit UvrA [Sphaerochaetaceae bacterium]
MNDKLIIRGASEHNLKHVDLDLEKNKLIVISGLSGSGKSSLAFDTIFAEGQRRYVESLSSYARMFLGRLDKPEVEMIEGLSPAIAIEQKTTGHNPRSTVGTITEIYDYYRLLWARVGEVHCPQCGRTISRMSVDQIIDAIFTRGGEGSRIMIMAPVALGRKGEYKKVLEDAKKAGYQRVKIDGQMHLLDETFNLDKQVKHTISIVIDRLILSSDARLRLADSIEKSTDMTNGLVEVTYIAQDRSESTEMYSEQNSCPHCGISIGEIQPRLFSFNNPFGACPECNGLGFKTEYDIKKIIPDPSKSFDEGAIACMNPDAGWSRAGFEGFAKSHGFTLQTPFEDLTSEQMNAVLYGSSQKYSMKYEDKMGKMDINRRWHGVINDLKRRYAETESMSIRSWISSFQTEVLCPECKGKRLRPEALSVYVGGKNIEEATRLSIKDSYDFFLSLNFTPSQQQISFQILKEIRARLTFLKNVGLNYLTMNRNAGTLSGGEAQRIRLATQIGSALSGVLYVLDEPSIGLHQRDNQRLIDTLKNLRDIGNTVLVVEHDEATMRNADYIVDMGPGAGEHGGYVIAEGTPEEIEKNPNSITGQFLSGKIQIPVPFMRRPGNGKFLKVIGANKNNLHHVDFEIPLGKLVILTGVSGSGKSTLLNQILTPALRNVFNKKPETFDGYSRIEGIEHLDKLIHIDQSPIGKTPRSNPATYVEVWGAIRELYAGLPESKARGYKGGRFSFNVQGGRCEHCHGDGTIKIEMNFLPDVFVTCDVCRGKRFNQETLSVHYKGKTIADVLDMSVSEALEFFQAVPTIKRKLQTLESVGLGYIKLGQSALTLSGGEAQRIKLSLELSKIGTGKTLYVLDEPTTGLHFADIKKLMEVVDRLVEAGNTVVMIEHNLDVIKLADHIIDLGPEGGDGGGNIVAQGTPEQVALCKESHTGYYLSQILSN